MSAKRQISTISKVIAYVLLILAVVGIIGFIAVFTNGFTSDFKTFYLRRDKVMYTADSGDYYLPAGEELRFDVGYTFDVMDNDDTPKGYTVKVIPNVTDETKFTLVVDDEEVPLSEDTDLTSVFGITKYDEYFTLTLPTELTVKDIYETAYEGKTVSISDTDIAEQCYFSIVATSYDGKASIRINFRPYVGVEGIRFEKENIVL